MACDNTRAVSSNSHFHRALEQGLRTLSGLEPTSRRPGSRPRSFRPAAQLPIAVSGDSS